MDLTQPARTLSSHDEMQYIIMKYTGSGSELFKPRFVWRVINDFKNLKYKTPNLAQTVKFASILN